jgi:outer membrane biosynthesis protein TonB
VKYLQFVGGKYSMARTQITDIQNALNVIRNELNQADMQARLQALELMLAASVSVVAMARKLTQIKPKTIVKPAPLSIPKPKKPSPKPAPVTRPKPKPSLKTQKPIPPVS